jgi:hypothetical protein
VFIRIEFRGIGRKTIPVELAGSRNLGGIFSSTRSTIAAARS